VLSGLRSPFGGKLLLVFGIVVVFVGGFGRLSHDEGFVCEKNG
jgi:hypothetical protein